MINLNLYKPIINRRWSMCPNDPHEYWVDRFTGERIPYRFVPGNSADYDNKRKRQCLHSGCSECRGSGRKQNGEACVHMLSCDCERCSPGRM